jgi:hypothetical protein
VAVAAPSRSARSQGSAAARVTPEEKLVASLIALLEAGTTPWRREWDAAAGGHQIANLLRRKIQVLLPAMDGEPLILDFSGVKSASSSFLDELLGRLAEEDPRGQAVFDGPVRIQGMNPTVQAMANVVVAQRLGH